MPRYGRLNSRVLNVRLDNACADVIERIAQTPEIVAQCERLGRSSVARGRARQLVLRILIHRGLRTLVEGEPMMQAELDQVKPGYVNTQLSLNHEIKLF